jgi:hypothetical protein
MDSGENMIVSPRGIATAGVKSRRNLVMPQSMKNI